MDVSFSEMGDFVNQPMQIESGKSGVIFSREGGIYKNGVKNVTSLTKEYKTTKDGLSFDFSINSATDSTYVMELNLHFNNMAEATINGKSPPDSLKGEKSDTFIIVDKHTPKGIEIKLNQPVELYAYIAKTLSQSESGADLTDQGGICILMPFEMDKKN